MKPGTKLHNSHEYIIHDLPKIRMNTKTEVKIINTNSNETILISNEESVSKQKENTDPSYIVMVGDTTVRLNFKGKGDITARLAAAFNTMQG